MSAATDKAQFYLEQQVPELRELEAKGIFTKDEIRQIVRRRRDFEHVLCAPGASPGDCAAYISYESSLEEMRALRAWRAGAKTNRHSGPRRMFPLLERATRKFPGDVGLWMTRIQYARGLGAHKRVRKALADAIRLHPHKAELWVYAARYEFEEQGDLTEAEQYVQRGLRMSPKSELLYLEFFRLLLDSLHGIEVKSRKLGLYGAKKETLVTANTEDADEDQIMLPSAEEIGFEADDDVDPKVVEALEKTRGPHEKIAQAIFDSAVKQFKGAGDLELASRMFDIAAAYRIPGRIPLLVHIYTAMTDRDTSSAWTTDVAYRLTLAEFDIDTSDFALGLGQVLQELTPALKEDTPEARKLHLLSARWIHRYSQVKDADERIALALRMTLLQIVDSYRELVEEPKSGAWSEDFPRPYEEAVELLEMGKDAGGPEKLILLQEAAVQRWPSRAQYIQAVEIS